MYHAHYLLHVRYATDAVQQLQPVGSNVLRYKIQGILLSSCTWQGRLGCKTAPQLVQKSSLQTMKICNPSARHGGSGGKFSSQAITPISKAPDHARSGQTLPENITAARTVPSSSVMMKSYNTLCSHK